MFLKSQCVCDMCDKKTSLKYSDLFSQVSRGYRNMGDVRETIKSNDCRDIKC